MLQQVMAHLVLGYPSLADSLSTAEQYITAGCGILELQIPFSHPTADGPVITQACREAVEQQHVSVADCMHALAELRAKYPEQEIAVMSYLNRAFAFGFDAFNAQLAALGIRYTIIPDLPVDSPLARQYFGADKAVQLIPVLAANIAIPRLDQLLRDGFDFFYLMSDFKITGSGFSLHPHLELVVARIRAQNAAARIGIGFGISTPEQVRTVQATADLAIIGSSLIKAQLEGRLTAYLESLRA
jgi:tryptophan synthase alpha chain